MSNVQFNLNFRNNNFKSAKALLVYRLTNTFEGGCLVSAVKLLDRRQKELVANDVESAIGKVARYILACRKSAEAAQTFYGKIKVDGIVDEHSADCIVRQQYHVVEAIEVACDKIARWDDDHFSSVEEVFDELNAVGAKAGDWAASFAFEEVTEFFSVLAEALDEVIGSEA